MEIAEKKRTQRSVASQTPFERSLAKRISKAYAICELLSGSEIYTPRSDIDTIERLREELALFDILSISFFEAVDNYVDVALTRKQLFKGAKDGIKETSYEIKKHVTRDMTSKKPHQDEVKELYAAIYAQNPLAPPYDFAKPTLDKDLGAFFLSYSTLFGYFKLLVEKVRKNQSTPETCPFSVTHCETLLLQAENLTKEVEHLLQKVYVLNEERRYIFEQIKNRCTAICNRSRHVLGSHDDTYKWVNRHRLSIM
ncbi:hypothetical protein SAMN05216327_110191 [Dyadobacter sp. SG02]|uniref:hypothetical protein n=1 Tax=Dyadobacter sp. SG02 TaxID=1855291 RepID=UPI0008C70627|nr:hypothetical protein [Dyadobacter sp. SG02]SEJ44564.1 hypothetical protein SAMN05216327_110191 [Dyadobacter sp. SG02]